MCNSLRLWPSPVRGLLARCGLLARLGLKATVICSVQLHGAREAAAQPGGVLARGGVRAGA